MKLRRIFAALAACAIAATSVISASAANGNIEGTVGLENVVDGENKAIETGTTWSVHLKVLKTQGQLEGIAMSDIYGFSVTFDKMDLSGGVGGAIVMQTQDKTWDDNSKEWGNDGAKKPITMTEDFVLTRLETEPFFSDADVDPTNSSHAECCLQTYWGPATVKVVSFSLLGKDGKVLKTFPVAANNTNNNSSNNNSNNNGDKKDNSNKPTGASAGLALAGLALAGVAVVATKKSK